MGERIYKVVLTGFAVLVVLVLVLRLGAVWNGERLKDSAAGRFSAEILPLKIDSFKRPEVEEPDNAAYFVRGGSLVMPQGRDDVQLSKKLAYQPLAQWSGEDLTAARRLVAEGETALTVFARASELDATRSSFELDWEEGSELIIPNLLAILRGARLLLVDTKLALAEGRMDDARQAARSLWTLAHVTYNEPIMIFDLIAVAIERHYWEAVHEIVLGGGEDVLATAVELSRQVDLDEAFRRSVAGEAFFLSDITDAGMESYVTTRELTAWDRYVRLPLKSYAIAKTIDYYRGVLREVPGKTLTELRTLPGKPLPVPDFPGSEEATVNLDSVALKQKMLEAQRVLASAALALLDTAREDGTYPAEIPGRPTSPLDGQPLAWQPEDLVVSLPGAREMWEERFPPDETRRPLPLRVTWSLPPR